ncbi:MAG: short-chain fatty acids transporter [Patiriisocius sp.]|jgi:short-chain fatty acids transporter
MLTKLGEKFTDLFKKNMPDAFVFAIILTFIAAGAAIITTNASLLDVIGSWYQGFWMLLEFGMQMVLLIITGYSIALSPLAEKGINGLTGHIKTPKQVYFVTVLLGILLGLISWGWIIITALFARELAKRVEGVNYAFLIACVYFSMSGWVTGFSSSIPLLLNTPNNYLIDAGLLSDIIPTSYTLGSGLNIAMIVLFIVVTPILMVFLISRLGKGKSLQELSDNYSEYEKPILEEANDQKLREFALSDKLNNSWILTWLIGLSGLVYIIRHFLLFGFDLNLNIMIFIFLMLGMLLHKTPIRYGISMKRSSANVSGILFQFPFYAGIMGIMIHTGLGEHLSTWLASVATIDNYPFFAFLSGAIVNFAIPSAGGEFAVIGPSVIEAVQSIGSGLPDEEVTKMISRAAMSMAYGESLTNALQPFFLLLVLPIMGSGVRIQARDIMGYLVIPFLLYFVIQSTMVVLWPL